VPVIPLGFSNLVHYAFRALGTQQVTFQRLWLFLSFDLRRIRPSEARRLISELLDKGDLIDQDGVLAISSQMIEKEEALPSHQLGYETSPLQELGKLLSHFVGKSRLSSAVGIDDSAVDIKDFKETPVRIKADIQGTRLYQLILDEGAKVIRHNCPDWLRKRKLRRFCKHIAKLFLLLEKDESVRLLTSILEEPWQFEAL
jgi:hypothetical protein